ncbi:hypothetical protein [Burkholderia glumae]
MTDKLFTGVSQLLSFSEIIVSHRCCKANGIASWMRCHASIGQEKMTCLRQGIWLICRYRRELRFSVGKNCKPQAIQPD